MKPLDRCRLRMLLVTAVALTGLLGPASSRETAAVEPAGAYELLARVETAYRELAAYADRGTLEIEVPGEPSRRFGFETRWRRLPTPEGPVFLFRLDRVAAPTPRLPAGARYPWKVLWREPSGPIRLWDADRDRVRESASLASALAHGVLEGGPDTLPVPGLLLGLDVVHDPEAAALDGEEPCGEGARCTVVALSRLGGAIQMRLGIEEATYRVRRAEVELGQPTGSPSLPAAPRFVDEERPVRLRWEIEPQEVDSQAMENGTPLFVPPPETRAVSGPVAGRLTGGQPQTASPGDPQAVFGERIEVALATVEVRVVDGNGRPVVDLGPDDFRVLFTPDRQRGSPHKTLEVPVVAVDWSGPRPGSVAAGDAPEAEAEDRDAGADDRLSPDEPWEDPLHPSLPTPPGPQRVLLFVQSDVNAVRTRGHLRFLPWVKDLLDQLPPSDPVGVVGFGSHLELWQDFTLDRKQVEDAVWGAIHFGGRPEVPRASRQGDLYRHLDFAAAQKAALPEQGLEVAARALEPLPGAKTVIWLGWGLGVRSKNRVAERADYYPALEALEAARATVFVIDITDAAYHDLEFGLEQVASDTGGTYAKGHETPDALVRNLAANVAGSYLLRIDEADLPRRPGRLEVELASGAARRRLRVLLPPLRWVPGESGEAHEPAESAGPPRP